MRHDSKIQFLYFSLLFSMFCSHDQAFKKNQKKLLHCNYLMLFLVCRNCEKNNVIKHMQKQSPEMFCKKRCSQKFCKIHRKIPVPDYLACNFIKKESLAQVKFCKIFKNTFFIEHIWVTASAHVMNLQLFLILESVNMIIVLICCKNMTIIFSKSVSNSLFVLIVSYCIGKKHLKKYFTQQCQIICCGT